MPTRTPSTTKAENWPPDYLNVLVWRQEKIRELRANPELFAGAFEFYANNPVAFINHWCDTYDPRNALTDKPVRFPFIMFPKQAEFVNFLVKLIQAQENGLCEKARDIGATWLCCAVSVWLWRFKPGAAVGWGSRKEELVDKIGNPDSIFEKMRILINYLPRFFWPKGFNPKDHMTYMRIVNPENGSIIAGEAGDNIGRGGRKLIYFKDESAHYERPEKIEAALADNTRVQVDISSVNGLGNVFHRRREAGAEYVGGDIARGRTNVFIMDWSDHPDKTQAWYDARKKKATEEGLLHVFAQEVERNYSAAVENVLISNEWFKAAIDADEALGLNDDGAWVGALDVADGGADSNAFSARKGICLKHVDSWGERDTGVTTRKVVGECGTLPINVQYDCIGVGSGVKSEINRLAEEDLLPKNLKFTAWNAAAKALNPDEPMDPEDPDSPLNKDFYSGLKAQAWWQLARRFERTWRARYEKGFTCDPADLISISSKIPLLRQLEKEMSQVTFRRDGKLRIVINKAPEGTKSPNLADSVVMNYWPLHLSSYDATMSWV